MIELRGDSLVFSFPDVHPDAKLTIAFQRTLRIPDDGKTYPLPPGLGKFPVRDVDDFSNSVPTEWQEHGGVMLPMYQSEAMWILFQSQYLADRGTAYPFAIKVAAGKVCAVSGKTWTNDLASKPQNFVVSPTQPWLDGFCVGEGTIRQFVAMPLGAGYTAEEQVTGAAEHGGLQLLVSPMKREAFDRRFPVRPLQDFELSVRSKRAGGAQLPRVCLPGQMGIAAGGKMRQQIFASRYSLDEWDSEEKSRCFVHIVNSMAWQSYVGESPPHVPPRAKRYAQAGLPCFDYYDDSAPTLSATSTLSDSKIRLNRGRCCTSVRRNVPARCDRDGSDHAGPRRYGGAGYAAALCKVESRGGPSTSPRSTAVPGVGPGNASSARASCVERIRITLDPRA